MSSHPTPNVIATQLRQLARLLEDQGPRVIDLAAALATRGMPSAVGGSGSRSADTTTSVERAAGTHLDTDRNDHWDDIDLRLARLLRIIWRAALETDTTINRIAAHGNDLDPLPAGTGNCVCCGTFTRPDHRHPDRRLRSGFCPPCHQAWLRWRQTRTTDRNAFIHARRKALLAAAEERERKTLNA